MTSSDARIDFLKRINRYEVRSISKLEKRTLEFQSEPVGANTYSRGIATRGEGIGRVYFLNQIHFNHGDTIIDCGANTGDLLLWFQNKKLDIEYIAFEPSVEEYRCLKKNIFPHKAINSALWSSEGEKDFFVSPDNGDSSIFEPVEFKDVYKVKTERLEKYIKKDIKLLKVEGEGAEPEIIEGLGIQLESVQYISADLSDERGLTLEYTVTQVTNFLLSNNFEMLDFSPDRFIFLFRNKKISLNSNDLNN
tara:strand:- start:837 stop:1586 length:750 start_codon:yes stop_codon:yes gene_type:complete